MNDKELFEKILETIGRDDDFLVAFANVLGVTEQQLGDFIDFVEIPELTRTATKKGVKTA